MSNLAKCLSNWTLTNPESYWVSGPNGIRWEGYTFKICNQKFFIEETWSDDMAERYIIESGDRKKSGLTISEVKKTIYQWLDI